jgi:TRAP transporter 4TM/12TM fusion protein
MAEPMNEEGRSVPQRSGLADLATRWLCIGLGLFVLYTAAFGQFDSLLQRPIFTAFTVAITVLIYPLWHGTSARTAGVLVDAALIAVALAACLYVAMRHDDIMVKLPEAGALDMALTAGLVVAVLEAARRAVGWVFPALVVVGILYAFFGQHLSGPLSHRGFDPAFFTETLLLGDLGIWGLLTGVAGTTIAAFVLFGSTLLFTGAGQTFMDLAIRVGGRSPGGAAKIATIASGLFGTISGSAVANVATTGNFTIPLMQRLGYPGPFAAAVEAVASTGGQIAPPIMGAAAFVMAEIVGVGYGEIMVAAIMPAFLFYLGVFLTIHVVAVRRGLPLVPEEEIPAWRTVLAPAALLPIIASFAGLLGGIFTGRSVQTSAFWGILGLFLAHFLLRVRSFDDLKSTLRLMLDALDDAGRSLVLIGILLIGAQILVAIINLTGVGISLSSYLAGAAGSSIFLLALLVGLICLILGMGIPTTAAYVLVASVLAPALTKAGMPPLAAHMFVFYFATVSVITPPVCIAVFVAAGIAKTPWLPVAIEACKLGAVTYVVPFLFLIYPGMLAEGSWLQIADALASGVLFTGAFALLFGGARLTGVWVLDVMLLLFVVALAILPYRIGLLGAVALSATLLVLWTRPRRPLASE